MAVTIFVLTQFSQNLLKWKQTSEKGSRTDLSVYS